MFTLNFIYLGLGVLFEFFQAEVKCLSFTVCGCHSSVRMRPLNCLWLYMFITISIPIGHAWCIFCIERFQVYILTDSSITCFSLCKLTYCSTFYIVHSAMCASSLCFLISFWYTCPIACQIPFPGMGIHTALAPYLFKSGLSMS